METPANLTNLRLYLEKFTNFYKFLKDHEHFEVVLFGENMIPKGVQPVLAATLFVVHVRDFRRNHPGLVKNIHDWAESYYESKQVSQLTELTLFTDIFTELVKIYKSKITFEELKKLLEENLDDAVILIRYLDLFYDLDMIPDSPQTKQQ